MVYRRKNLKMNQILLFQYFSGKREFDQLVNFVETGKFEFYEYPFEDDEMEGEEVETNDVEIEDDDSDKVEVIENDQEDEIEKKQPVKEEL